MTTETVEKKYFLSVDWCNKGRRGIFSSKDGAPFSQDHPHSEEEIQDILDAFYLILSPQSLELTQEELKEYNKWIPLAEYSNQYGIAVKAN